MAGTCSQLAEVSEMLVRAQEETEAQAVEVRGLRSRLAEAEEVSSGHCDLVIWRG
jgi:hypothetical protein